MGNSFGTVVKFLDDKGRDLQSVTVEVWHTKVTLTRHLSGRGIHMKVHNDKYLNRWATWALSEGVTSVDSGEFNKDSLELMFSLDRCSNVGGFETKKVFYLAVYYSWPYF